MLTFSPLTMLTLLHPFLLLATATLVNVVIANKATLNVDAGPLDPSKLVGFGCSLPRVVITQSAVSCTNVFLANDGTFTAVNCTMAAT
ncbi:hypothetical protein F5146DRAFT_1016323 [Armillaria mellea]|nr:hypothetical protein F5146DRAFT_1016323 [Armillaria mellea]